LVKVDEPPLPFFSERAQNEPAIPGRKPTKRIIMVPMINIEEAKDVNPANE
jgi:hypothetical protein